ncbi:hypothetical protein C8R46DRAFT_1028408 [Mycena filopes]|nr:hypothetical protein C8R46DRAFT_1028408 [Mycena filopes]
MTEIHEGKELLILCGMARSGNYHELLSAQAEIHMCKSEYAEAKRIHATNFQESRLEPDSLGYAFTLLNSAEIDILIGTRREIVCQTLKTASKTPHLRGQTWGALLLSGHLDLREGSLASARAVFQDCLKVNLGKDTALMMYCLEQLANVTQWPIKFHKQSRWPVLYLCQAHKSKDKLHFSKALLFYADLFTEDNEVTAQSLLTVAREEFTFMDVHRSRAQCMMRLGDLEQKKGKTTEAADLWRSARPLFERSLQAKDVARIDERLGALEQESLRKLAKLPIPMTLLVENSSEGNSENNGFRQIDGAKAMPI